MPHDPFKNIGTLRAMEEMMRRQRQLDDLMKTSAALRSLEQFDRLAATAKMFEKIERNAKLSAFTHSPAYLKALEIRAPFSNLTRLSAQIEASQLAVRKISEIGRFSELAAARVAPYENLIGSSAWAATIADRMSAIPVEWAVVDAEENSAEAFARLSRLSDVTRLAPTYTDETTEILVDELGVPVEAAAEPETLEMREERYDAAGRDRQLIAFPPPAYGEILVSAGHFVSFPPPPTVGIQDGLIEPVQFSPETGSLLQSLEAHLREVVETRLKALEGEAWLKRRVPEGVRQKWTEGREAAKAAGKPVFAPIHYANFMDLADVITAGNNWSEFQALFTNRDNLRVGLLRLYGIRNDIAHARPISMSDQLIAVSEGAILFRAMGLPVTFSR